MRKFDNFQAYTKSQTINNFHPQQKKTKGYVFRVSPQTGNVKILFPMFLIEEMNTFTNTNIDIENKLIKV